MQHRDLFTDIVYIFTCGLVCSEDIIFSKRVIHLFFNKKTYWKNVSNVIFNVIFPQKRLRY